MTLVYFGLGSNIGDREGNLSMAIANLLPEVSPISISRVYETDPWGYEEQDPFLNQVISAETDLSPLALLRKLKQVENDLGRVETFRYGPRLIDLDLLFYDGRVLESDELQIPHPRISDRAFVLIPMREISPDFIHPVLGQTIIELCAAVDEIGVRLYEPSKQ